MPPSSASLPLQRLVELLTAFLLPKPDDVFQLLSFVAHHPAVAVATVAQHDVASLPACTVLFQVAIALLTVPAVEPVTVFVGAGSEHQHEVASLPACAVLFPFTIARLTVPAVVVFVGAGSEHLNQHGE